MLLSLRWIRELCAFPATAAEAARALTARGLTVDAVRDAGDDTILDVDVPANRPDCLGHLGIARELSAAFGVELTTRPGLPLTPVEGSVADALRVEIDAPDLCRRYTARLVRGVRVGPSPAWVAQRLAACGLHSINNVVDVSNLVLLETGHPIHTFDFAKVGAGMLRIRRAQDGEPLVTLDGVERRLASEMLVIADANRAVALAGVIGGRDSQIVPDTRAVLVEAAWFLPRSVRATARRLGITTDASHRFERGVDPEGALAAQDLALRWLAELAGGTPTKGTIDVRAPAQPQRRLRLRRERVRLLLGYEPTGAEIVAALDALKIPHGDPGAAGIIDVGVPSWRVDLEREVDLVEEVARHLGYERIPKALPLVGAAPPPAQPAYEAAERSRDVLAHLGFHEAFCYSMTGTGDDDPFVLASTGPALPLANPIAETMGSLRRSLLAGLVRAADLNLRRGAHDVRLFEVGSVFLARAAGVLPDEPLRVGVVWTGASQPPHWSRPSTLVRLPEIAGVVERILDTVLAGATVARTEPPEGRRLPGFRPGACAEWRIPDATALPVAKATGRPKNA